jgi:AraC-like DNA-binding protein
VVVLLGAELTQRKPLLHKFPVCDTGAVDAAGAAVAPFFGNHLMEPERRSKAFQARINICRLQKIALLYGSFGDPFRVQVPWSGNFVHGFPIRGTGEHVSNGMAILNSPTRGAVGGPGPLKLSYGPNFEVFSLFVSPGELAKTLSGFLGAPLSGELKLSKSNYDSRPEARLLRKLVQLLIAELDDENSVLSPLALAELEQSVLVAFLCGTGHNYSHLLDGRPRDSAPWQVRRVEEYIEAHWDQPVSIEALAVVANASARSIFQTFRDCRGYSPMNFLKQVRLKHAKELLTAPDPDTSVTAVSYACGFGNLGHFASDYWEIFGERPSETLQRARGIRPPAPKRLYGWNVTSGDRI